MKRTEETGRCGGEIGVRGLWDEAKTSGARGPLCGQLKVERWLWGIGGQVWELADLLIMELSSVLNLERGPHGAVCVDRFGAARRYQS